MATPREQQAKGNWNQFKGRVKEAWGNLTGDDMDRYEGQRDQLIGHIQEQTGEAREDIRRRIDQFSTDTKYRFER